ncbi:MAG: winged helix-turn-helix transcriptional regulator [Thermoplasmata archaeon]
MSLDTLELEPRKKIYEAIKDNPGTHLRKLDRILDMPLGTIRYHLRVLDKRSLIVSKKEGKYKRFYVRGEIDTTDKNRLAVLRKEFPRTIILYLLEFPGSTHKEISEVMDVAPSTLSYHLKKLVDEDMITASQRKYRVKNEKEVADLLIQYRRTFLDSLVDRFVRMWTRSEEK